MKRYQKITALLLALLLLCAPLFGCSDKMATPVGTCGGYEILYGELRYLVLTQKDAMKEAYGSTIFDTPESAEAYRAELTAAVTEKLLENYAVLAACADYIPDVSIDDDVVTNAVEDFINDSIDQAESAGNDFWGLSELFHMTESFIRFTSAVAVMEDLLIERLVQNGSIFDQNKSSDFANWIKDGNGVYVQHILIRHDAGDDKAANRALAESTAEALRDGDLTLSDVIGGNAALGISPINEDTENTTPYYLVRGVYEEALEAAAFSIGKSGVSSVAETDEGCYIFVRVEDPDYLLLNLQLSSILSSYQWAYAESLIAPYREKLTIEWNEYGSSLDWLSIT